MPIESRQSKIANNVARKILEQKYRWSEEKINAVNFARLNEDTQVPKSVKELHELVWIEADKVEKFYSLV